MNIRLLWFYRILKLCSLFKSIFSLLFMLGIFIVLSSSSLIISCYRLFTVEPIHCVIFYLFFGSKISIWFSFIFSISLLRLYFFSFALSMFTIAPWSILNGCVKILVK